MTLKLEIPPWASPDHVSEALARFGLAQAPTRRINVAENGTWRVDTPSGRFALRLYRPGRWSDDAIAEEHALMRFLGPQQGVLPPRPGLDGETLQPIEGGRAALFPWVPGRFAKKVKPHHVRLLGATLAALHQQLQSYPLPSATQRPRWDRTSLLSRHTTTLEAGWALHAPEEPCPFLDAIPLLEDAWDDAGPLPEALLHADLHFGNCTFHQGRVYPIDFDDCGVAPLAYDLAVVAQATRRTPDLRTLLLQSYNDARPPEPLAFNTLALLEAARVVWITAWVFERPDVFSPHTTQRLLPDMRARLSDVLSRLQP